MPVGDFLVGLAFWALTWGASIAAAEIVRRRRLAHLTGPRAVLATGLLSTAALLAAHLVPGALGVLSRWSALILALALVAASLLLRHRARRPSIEPPDPRPDGPASWAFAAVAVGTLVVGVLLKAWNSSVTPSEDIDTVTFHLPNVARWIQSGSFWQIDQFNPLLASGNYPQNGDVVFLSVLQAWENDAFARLVNIPFVALAAVAVYALARELRSPRATSVLFAAVFASLPVVSLAAYEGAKTDSIFLATFTAGAVFALRHFRSRDPAELVLAGIGLGIALGTKWYGIYSVPAVLLVWGAATLLAKGRGPRLVRDGAALTGVTFAFGGFWLVRNWVESGDPIFPVAVRIAGVTLWDAPRDFIRECAGYRIVDYLAEPRIWADYILPAYRDNYRLGGVLLALGVLGAVVASAVSLVRARRGRGESAAARPELPAVAAVAAAALVITAAYSITPYTAFGLEGEPTLVGANTRWLGGALALAAPLAAWAVGRLGRVRLVAEAVALVAVVDGLRHALHLPLASFLAAAIALALAALAAYAIWAGSARLRRPGVARVAAAALAVVALVAVGHSRQQKFNDGRYEGSDAALTWLAQNARSGHRIGLAGVWGTDATSPVWTAFGPRLDNHVEFVGPFVDGQLREYETRAAWVDAVRRGRFDLLIVGRRGYARECPVPGQETDDDAWARAEGFEVVARTPALTVYRVSSPRA